MAGLGGGLVPGGGGGGRQQLDVFWALCIGGGSLVLLLALHAPLPAGPGGSGLRHTNWLCLPIPGLYLWTER